MYLGWCFPSMTASRIVVNLKKNLRTSTMQMTCLVLLPFSTTQRRKSWCLNFDCKRSCKMIFQHNQKWTFLSNYITTSTSWSILLVAKKQWEERFLWHLLHFFTVFKLNALSTCKQGAVKLTMIRYDQETCVSILPANSTQMIHNYPINCFLA